MTYTWEELKPIFRPKLWEELKPIFRPNLEDHHMGRLKADPEKCHSCGLCIQNCPFRAWEMDENNIPRMKEGWPCLACYNCKVACPVGAISVVHPYYVDSGFWKTQPIRPIPQKLPLEPQDVNGKTDKWNEVERVVFTRRSVRNFSDKPVPEPLIRRVLEAGRFAPSGGNSQPWKFIVITNKTFIDELDETAYGILKEAFDSYLDDNAVKELAKQYNPDSMSRPPGLWDLRLLFGGIGKAVVPRPNKVLLGAPVVILLCADYRAVGGPETQIGICGQNMSLTAQSLGLRSCWVSFIRVINNVPSMMEKLGLEDPFFISTSLAIGYPRFKQDGIVPRDYRPITWFREEHDGPEIDDVPPIKEVKDIKEVTKK